MIFLLGLVLLLLTQTGFFFLSLYLRTHKFNTLFFYIALFLITFSLFFSAGELNFAGLIIWFAVLNWSLWHIIYSIYLASKQKSFKFHKFNSKRQVEFCKRQTVALFFAILPLLFSFSLDYKKFSYSGFSNFILVLGCFVAILGFILKMLIISQKIGLEKSADDYIWEKHGIWHYAKINSKLADIFTWSGIFLLTLSCFLNFIRF